MDYQITGLEPGAGQSETNQEAIEAYDSLDGWTQELSSTGAMLSALDDAIGKEKPIMITGWSPHYMFANWDLKYLDDPEGIYGVDKVDGTPIKLVSATWDDALFSSNVAKVVLTNQGFDVELTPIDPAILFESVATGESDASLSPWVPATHGEFYDAYEGKFEDFGPNLNGVRIGIAVPIYMEIDSLADLEQNSNTINHRLNIFR